MPTAEELAARLEVRRRPRQGEFADVVLPDLPDVPGMVAASECRYLYWLVRETYVGKGAVVEVGTWLGRSALHLAAGLRDAGLGGTLYCFDRFRWQGRRPVSLDLALGDDTLPLVRDALLPVYPNVVITATEIKDLRWRREPIEILFLDAPKAHRPFVKCLREFGPSLQPGVSVIISQDFAYPRAFAQALCLGRLEDHVELVHVAENLAAFLVKKALPEPDRLKALLDPRTFTARESLRIWEGILERIEPERTRRRMRPGICFHLYEIGERRLACRLIREMEFRPRMTRLWAEWAATPEIFQRYSRLFTALGMEPERRRSRWFWRGRN